MKKGKLPSVILKSLLVAEDKKIICVLNVSEGFPSEYFTFPIAPAQLATYDQSGKMVYSFPLHKLIDQKNEKLIFETYEYTDDLPKENKIYTFQSWFTPEQLDLIQNETYKWVKKRIPENIKKDYCQLSWEPLIPGKFGYTNNSEWISERAYSLYIKNDILRIGKR